MSHPIWVPSSMIYVPPHDPSPNLQTALAYIEARNAWFSSADNVSAVDRMMAVFDEDLEHRILPRSLGRPVLNKTQYKGYVNGLLSFIREYRVHIYLSSCELTDLLFPRSRCMKSQKQLIIRSLFMCVSILQYCWPSSLTATLTGILSWKRIEWGILLE